MASQSFITYRDECDGENYFEWTDTPTVLRDTKEELLATEEEEEDSSLAFKFPRWKILGHVEGTTAHVFCLLHGESHTHIDVASGNWTLEEDYCRVTLLIPYDGSPITVDIESYTVRREPHNR